MHEYLEKKTNIPEKWKWLSAFVFMTLTKNCMQHKSAY